VGARRRAPGWPRDPPVGGQRQPGAVLADGAGRPVAVWALDVADGRIRSVRSVVNPDELTPLGPVVGPELA
jgi:hypothetical protein